MFDFHSFIMPLVGGAIAGMVGKIAVIAAILMLAAP